MIYILIVILFIASIIGVIIAEKEYLSSLEILSSIGTIIFGVCFLICAIKILGEGFYSQKFKRLI